MLKVTEMIFYSTGIVKYDLSPVKLYLEIDQGLANYYRSLVPKAYLLRGPAYKAHISIIRKEHVSNIDKMCTYKGEKIEYAYSIDTKIDQLGDGRYCWLNVHCKRFEEIRLEIGLPRFRNIKRLENEIPCFHMTIGNFKHLL